MQIFDLEDDGKSRYNKRARAIDDRFSNILDEFINDEIEANGAVDLRALQIVLEGSVLDSILQRLF